MADWDVYKCEYKEGKCEICGEEDKLRVMDGIGRCQKCTTDWLIKKANE